MQRTILIAEDEPDNIKIYWNFFKDKPFKLIHAANGKIAVELAKEKSPDLILMDWNMPVMDGIEATRTLQEQEITQEIPVIIATGVMTNPTDLQVALDSGAYDYIRKPFDSVEMMARINSALMLNDSFQRIKYLLNREKALLKSELQHRERELSLATAMKQQMTGMINQVSQQLKEIQSASPAPIQHLIKSMRKDLEAHTDVDRTWEQFKAHFENVHPEYFERLRHQFPALTPNETRLCAYLKMGMGNQEICQINGIASTSIKKSLNRLKKKLSLSAQDNLRDFIADF